MRPNSKPKTERSLHFLVNTSAFYSCFGTVGQTNAAHGFPFYEYVNLV